MGRKRARFEWVRDDAEGELVREGVREDRKALKARLAEIERLVLDLAALPGPARAALPLDPEILEALEVLVALPVRGGARKRQLGFVRGLLRDVDPEPLHAAVTRSAGRERPDG